MNSSFTLSSGGAGESSQNYFAECFWENELGDCETAADDQCHGRQVAAALLGTGVSGLQDELRPGRRRPVSDERVAQPVSKKLKSKPQGARIGVSGKSPTRPVYRNRRCTAFGTLTQSIDRTMNSHQANELLSTVASTMETE